MTPDIATLRAAQATANADLLAATAAQLHHDLAGCFAEDHDLEVLAIRLAVDPEDDGGEWPLLHLHPTFTDTTSAYDAKVATEHVAGQFNDWASTQDFLDALIAAEGRDDLFGQRIDLTGQVTTAAEGDDMPPPSTPDGLRCVECDEPMWLTDTEVAHHTGDGPDGIDHDADADHVATGAIDEVLVWFEADSADTGDAYLHELVEAGIISWPAYTHADTRNDSLTVATHDGPHVLAIAADIAGLHVWLDDDQDDADGQDPTDDGSTVLTGRARSDAAKTLTFTFRLSRQQATNIVDHGAAGLLPDAADAALAAAIIDCHRRRQATARVVTGILSRHDDLPDGATVLWPADEHLVIVRLGRGTVLTVGPDWDRVTTTDQGNGTRPYPLDLTRAATSPLRVTKAILAAAAALTG